MNLRRLCFLFLLLIPFLGFSQKKDVKQRYADSVEFAIDEDKKTEYLLRLAELTQNENFIQSYEYSREAIRLAQKNKNVKVLVRAYDALGDAYWFHTDYSKAQSYYFKSYRINDSLNDRVGIANSSYNIGWIICIQQKKYNEAHYFYKALHTFTDLKDTFGISKVYNALGNMFNDKYAADKQKASFDSALKYYNLGIELQKIMKSNNKLAIFYANIGQLMSLSGDYKSAIYYTEKSQDYFNKSQDSVGYFLNLANLSGYHTKIGEADKALEMLHLSYSHCLRNDNRDVLITIYKNYYETYKAKNNSEKALFFLERYNSFNDSIQKEINSSTLNDLKNNYELEKKETSIQELKQANEIQELKTQKNRFALMGVGVILLVIIVIAYLLYKRNKEKNSANLLLKEQNAIISQKKQEIESSIHYAKGIQTSFFPDVNELKTVFPDSFIFYRPKDVVSGDFYWFHKIENYFYCLAADCTGHGVPGALMSIVSVDKISQALFEKKLREPSQILSHINVEIKKALKQHDDQSKQKDGLDIALLRFDLNANTVAFSGANRPLFVISNGNINEYKADKVAIAGFTPDHYEFNQTSVQLSKGDAVYVFSDGYADQFGGKDGKKFMTKNFKSLLLNVAGKSMEEQERQVLSAHYDWKGSYEQVDDILVIGIKI